MKTLASQWGQLPTPILPPNHLSDSHKSHEKVFVEGCVGWGKESDTPALLTPSHPKFLVTPLHGAYNNGISLMNSGGSNLSVVGDEISQCFLLYNN